MQRDTIKLQESNMILDRLNTEYARKIGGPLPPNLDYFGRTSSKTVIDSKLRHGSAMAGSSILEHEALEITVTSQSLGGQDALLQAGFGQKSEHQACKVKTLEVEDSREEMPET